jgi:hypothetical protein
VRVERLIVAALVLAPAVALSSANAAQGGRPVFQGEIQVGLSGERTCTLHSGQSHMPPGSVTFVVGNASPRGYAVVLAHRVGEQATRALGPGGGLRPGVFVDGLPAALPPGATAAFTPTLDTGRYDLWCTDHGRVRSLRGHAPFTVGAPRPPAS